MATKLLNPCFTRSLSTLGSVISTSKPDRTSKILNYFRRPVAEAPNPEVEDVECLPNPLTPWLMLSPERDNDHKEEWDRFYSPAENRVVRINREKSLGVPSTAKCVASTRGWLGFVDRKGLCPLYLSNPYKGNVVPLPSLSTLPRFTEPSRNIRDLWWCNSDYKWDDVDTKEMAEEPLLSRFTLSHPDPCNPDCVVAALQKHPDYQYRNISYFPIGRKMNNDTQAFKWFESSAYELDLGLGESDWQLVFSRTNNLFYAMHYEYGSCGMFNALDIHDESIWISQYYFKDLDPFEQKKFLESLEGPKQVKSLRTRYGPDYDYLVVSENGDLLVVFRYCIENEEHTKKPNIPTSTTLHFDVFKFDFENNQLKRLESLNGQSIFIGHNHSFCGDFSGTLRDSIYFCLRDYNNFDAGIFNMGENTIIPCYPFADDEERNTMHLFKDDPFWIAPNAYYESS